MSHVLISLACDGIIAGVGGVLTFLPQIALLFLFLSFLEDSGYMSRSPEAIPTSIPMIYSPKTTSPAQGPKKAAEISP